MLSVGGSLLYFNPRPPRGGRLECREHAGRNQCISIHALREEGDGSTTSTSGAFTIFQSTPSARRATSRFCLRLADLFYFNPRPPRGGRHFLGTLVPLAALISIHALREEGDPASGQIIQIFFLFQSTPSARRATIIADHSQNRAIISIHALREEGDDALKTAMGTPTDFNPRPPRGGRQNDA